MAYSRNGYIVGIAWCKPNAASCWLRLLKNGSLPITSAPARSWGKDAKTASKSRSVLACRTCSCNPRMRAATCRSRDSLSALVGLVGLTSRAMMVAVGTSSRSTSSCFGPSSTVRVDTPVRLPPGRFRLATSPSATGSPPCNEDDRYGRGRSLRSECRGSAGDCRNHGHVAANEIRQQRWKSIVLILRPAIFDSHVFALDIAGFAQALPECAQTARELVRRAAAKISDHRHRRLLRVCRQRPSRRAAEQRDELAPPHS